MKTVLPTYADLTAYFAVAGITVPTQSFCDDLITAIDEESDDYLNYNIYNTSSGISTAYYDYPSNTGTLWLPRLYNTISQVKLGTQVLSVNNDYWFKGNREIVLATGMGFYTNPQQIIVTGVEGLVLIPNQLWRGILDYAAWKVIYANPQRTFKKLVQADVTLDLGDPIDSEGKYFALLEGYKY